MTLLPLIAFGIVCADITRLVISAYKARVRRRACICVRSMQDVYASMCVSLLGGTEKKACVCKVPANDALLCLARSLTL